MTNLSRCGKTSLFALDCDPLPLGRGKFAMRGGFEDQGSLLSDLDPEDRIPLKHPLRVETGGDDGQNGDDETGGTFRGKRIHHAERSRVGLL